MSTRKKPTITVEVPAGQPLPVRDVASFIECELLAFSWRAIKTPAGAEVRAYPFDAESVVIATCPGMEAAKAVVHARMAAEVMTDYSGLLERLEDELRNAPELKRMLDYYKKLGIEPAPGRRRY